MARATRSSIFQIGVSRTEFILNYRTCFPWPRWVEAVLAGRGYTRPEGKRLEWAAEMPKNWANNEERVAASWWKATRVFHVKRVPLYFVRTRPWRGHAVHKRARVSFRQSLFSCSAVPAGYAAIGPPLKTKKAQGRRGGRWARGGVASATWKGGTWRNETLPNAVFSLREHRAFRAPQRQQPAYPSVCPLSPVIHCVISFPFQSIFLSAHLSRGFDFRVINDESRDRQIEKQRKRKRERDGVVTRSMKSFRHGSRG